MKKERKIQLVTDDIIEPPGEELTGVQAEIDALLRTVADDCSANIDFEGIKSRAVKAAEAKKAKRGRIRKAIGYGLITAASLLVGIAVIHSINQMKTPGPNTSAVDANAARSNTGSENQSAVESDWPTAENKRREVGSVSESEYRELSASSDALVPETLPDTLKKNVRENNGTVSATGSATKGGQLSYECSMEDGSARDGTETALKTGEAWFDEQGEELWVYWQVSDDHYMKVHFTGFDKEEAYKLFLSLSESVKAAER